MKSIYNKLNPDILASINADVQRYPYTTKHLINTLKTKKFWCDLTVSDVRAVLMHSHISIIDIQQEDLLWGEKFLIKDE